MIRIAEEGRLVEVLRYGMLLVGIRSQNLPQAEETAVLLHFVRMQYGGHRTEEIRLAFDLAITGQLDLGKQGASCYENFSCEYVGRIMTAYRKWALVQAEAMEVLPAEESKVLPPSDYNPMQMVDMFFQEHLAGTLNLDTVTERAYDIAAGVEDMGITAARKRELVNEAREYVISRYEAQLKTMAKGEQNHSAYYDIRAKLTKLKVSTDTDILLQDAYVKRYAKALTLQEWFEFQKEIGITNLLEINK